MHVKISGPAVFIAGVVEAVVGSGLVGQGMGDLDKLLQHADTPF